MTLGERIQKLRKFNKMTQEDLGGRLGVSAAMISQYERGIRTPNTEALSKIAHAFGMLLPDLLSYTEQDANGVIFEGVINMPAGEKVTINDMIEILGNYIALYAEKNPEDWKAAEIAASMKNNRFSLSDLGDIEKFQDFKRNIFADVFGDNIPFHEYALYAAISEFIWKDPSIEREETRYIDSFAIYEIFEKVKSYVEFETFRENQKRKKEIEEEKKK